MIQILINICSFIIIFLILIRSSDNIQFRRQLSSLQSLIGNAPPNEFKKKFDQIILILVLIWIGAQISVQFLRNN